MFHCYVSLPEGNSVLMGNIDFKVGGKLGMVMGV
jgi:hypothetical protein